ncbi:hypothetical protein CTAYLR_007609 [Chrysophaeum taylorii]|uniref:Acid ceramidase N-terminal domain-containing protein n=1 Tax=Chrysophaeum taylorii TaxID=2483200 RepID=A0AAD7U848_9STRA|nr:hypothetical protein CTAYLR_007609 [Chrysophaeum taylorii]
MGWWWVMFGGAALGFECPHGRPWLVDETRPLLGSSRSPGRVSVDLDLPPSQRWVAVGEAYRNQSYLITEYFLEFLPENVLDLLIEMFTPVSSYGGFGDYGPEMEGYARGLNVSVGLVVIANLAYQLEHIGVSCDNWNTTGPTGQCFYKRGGSGGPCTSIVADDKNFNVYHARNLDWNLGDDLRGLIVDVDFIKNGTLFYTGTTVVSFVGILNGMRPGFYSYSFDARCQGGVLAVNLVEALSTGAETPAQHARRVFEAAPSTFAGFVGAMASGDLLDDAYYILGGVKDYEGTVLTRARNRAVDLWPLNETAWFRLETNYDHWDPVPAADDRRTPGNARMNNLTQANVNTTTLFHDILLQWPTFNSHTDVSCVMAAFDSTYECRVAA